MSETPETPATPAAPAAPAAPKPAAPPPPPVKTLEEILADPLVADAVATVREHVLSAKEFAKEITLTIDRDQIVPVCLAFKNDGDFKYLVDLTGVDYSKYPNHTGVRFCVAYVLYSFSKNARVRLKVWTEEKWPVPSVSSVWKTANWHERETFDMFGIQFSGHPNLERILMWEGFNGHPLRKDFPIRGIDTGARIYPEVFPEGGGPSAGATGKTADDMNLYDGQWPQYGTNPEAAATGTARPGVAKVEEK